MKELLRYLSPIVVVATLGGCGFQESLDSTDGEIKAFHADLDSGQFEKIWDNADPQFKQMASKEQFVALLTNVNKFGKVQTSRRSSWKTNSSTSNGSMVTVEMQTTFERGQAVEEFVYRKGANDRMALLGYHIQQQREAFK